ncbi:TrkA family potassium uptake protein [uncultured Algimonas sp.]|uniref:potassium channel family protein n=1 Tax=uncultured Algimonas sp. TaxID=1547920 RepID=UPI00262A3831|nr:TrkA family potassium uptake protein [uncultured Algimonas sp.]
MFTSKSSVAVIGLGTFGIALARSLTEKGARVLGIDTSQHLVDRFHAELDNTIRADATDERALRECAIDDQDIVVIAIGSDVQACLLGTYTAKKLGAERIYAKAQTHAQKAILESIGVDGVIMPEMETGERAAEDILSSPES